MSKRKKKFKIHKTTGRMLAEKIKDLPDIPFYIKDPKNPENVIPAELVRYVDRKGSEILLEIPNATINGQPLDPEKTYSQRQTKTKMQDHRVAITAAYRNYGDEGVDAYCKEVWAFYEDIKSLPPEPKELALEPTPEISNEPQSLKLPDNE